jgi:hypothetical protein
VATTAAGPAALQAWTTAWCSWATSAAKTHDQLSRRWNTIIQDPSQGAAMLDKMREDFKQYLVEIGTIPERAILEFLQTMGERGTIGSDIPSLNDKFVRAADDAVIAITDTYSALAEGGVPPVPKRPGTGPRPRPGEGGATAPDPAQRLDDLQAKLRALKDARQRLGEASARPVS